LFPFAAILSAGQRDDRAAYGVPMLSIRLANERRKPDRAAFHAGCFADNDFEA
jgi:hypothetical protein